MLEELLKSSFQSQMNNVYTAIPCIVLTVYANGNTMMVDIQPTINQKMKDGVTKERTPILGVPTSFPVSKTAGFTFPISVGDTGLAIFSMRSMDTWKAGNGRQAAPSNFGKMDKSDAIFIPGIMPPGESVNNPALHVWSHDPMDAVVWNNLGSDTECEVRLKADGSIKISTRQPITVDCLKATVNATESIALNAPQMTVDVDNTTWIGGINLIGDLTHSGAYGSTGTATFNGIIFSTHKHGASPPPSN